MGEKGKPRRAAVGVGMALGVWQKYMHMHTQACTCMPTLAPTCVDNYEVGWPCPGLRLWFEPHPAEEVPHVNSQL